MVVEAEEVPVPQMEETVVRAAVRAPLLAIRREQEAKATMVESVETTAAVAAVVPEQQVRTAQPLRAVTAVMVLQIQFQGAQ